MGRGHTGGTVVGVDSRGLSGKLLAASCICLLVLAVPRACIGLGKYTQFMGLQE